MAAPVDLAPLHCDRQQPLVVGAQLGRRRDVVAHVVLDALEHDQRGLARDDAESLAEARDLGAVEVVLGLELGEPQARP